MAVPDRVREFRDDNRHDGVVGGWPRLDGYADGDRVSWRQLYAVSPTFEMGIVQRVLKICCQSCFRGYELMLILHYAEETAIVERCLLFF